LATGFEVVQPPLMLNFNGDIDDAERRESVLNLAYPHAL
jgi:hypothetical protein